MLSHKVWLNAWTAVIGHTPTTEEKNFLNGLKYETTRKRVLLHELHHVIRQATEEDPTQTTEMTLQGNQGEPFVVITTPDTIEVRAKNGKFTQGAHMTIHDDGSFTVKQDCLSDWVATLLGNHDT